MDLTQTIDTENMLVLIAEDDIITMQLLQTFLKKEKINFISSENGLAALATAKERVPDLILLDVMMPELDGYEVCRKLKECPLLQNIPVIFLTAQTDIANKIKGFEVGGVDYITKPFERLEVLARIKTQLRLKKALDKLSDYNIWLEKIIKRIDETEPEFSN